MKTSQNGINLIKQFEGCVLKVYLCPAGVPTCGYGHTAGLTKAMVGKPITQAQADAFLVSDLAKFESAVNKVKLNLNQNQFDALVSFTYNCGAGNLNKLVLGRTISQIADALLAYNKGGGKVLAGLTRRRQAERAMFLKGTALTSKNTCPYPEPTKVLKQGMSGNGVKWLQWMLNRCGIGYNLNEDGIYGNVTAGAVADFEKNMNLVVDFIAGVQVRTKLKELVNS